MTAGFTAATDTLYFELGDFELQSGETLRGARLAYQVLGHLRTDRGNAVLFPTYYTGTHRDNAKLVQPGRALDPAQWFVVIPNLFGNGVSSSPSNHPTQGGANFPRLTLLDNVRAQQRLLTEQYGIGRVALALGWSMGAQQAYHHAQRHREQPEHRRARDGRNLSADPGTAGGRPRRRDGHTRRAAERGVRGRQTRHRRAEEGVKKQ